MNKTIKYVFLFTLSCIISGALYSQNVINISGTQIVKKGEIYTVEAGQTIQFEPGATLKVEGSLKIGRAHV